MYKLVLTVVLLVVTNMSTAAEPQKNFLKVMDPYIEVHTGPGRGYPVYDVVGRDEWIEVLFRSTDWFKVRTDDKKEGWVSIDELKMTLDPSGARVALKDPGAEDYRARSWEYGAVIGDFSGASEVSFYGGYHFTENISTEVSLSQVVGSSSSSLLLGINILHQPFPEWKYSPFISLGTGFIDISPKSTVVQTQDRHDQFANVGIGVRMHLTKRFLLRLQYQKYAIFTSNNYNEDIDGWTLGFGFFY